MEMHDFYRRVDKYIDEYSDAVRSMTMSRNGQPKENPVSAGIFNVRISLVHTNLSAHGPGSTTFTYPYYADAGALKDPRAMRALQGTILSNTKWLSVWARQVDSVDPSKGTGAFTLVGPSSYFVMTDWEFDTHLPYNWPHQINGTPVELLTGLGFKVFLPVAMEGEINSPVVVGIAFEDKRIAVILYPLQVNPRGYPLGYYTNQVALPKLIGVRVPFPVTAKWDISNLSRPFHAQGVPFTEADVQVTGSLDGGGWYVGDMFYTENSQIPQHIDGFPAWDAQYHPLLHMGVTNAYTYAGMLLEGLRTAGCIPRPNQEGLYRQKKNEVMVQMNADQSYGHTSNGQQFFEAAGVTVPAGLKDLPNAPAGYEWAFNIMGLVLLVNRESGEVCPLHDAFSKVSSLSDIQRERLLALYRHQQDVLKGLAYSYKVFGDELE